MTGSQIFRLRIVVPFALILGVGQAATLPAQTVDDASQARLSRLPPVEEAASFDSSTSGNQSVPYNNGSPDSSDVLARLRQLEAQLAEQQALTTGLQQQLNSTAQSPAAAPPDARRYVVGSDTAMTGQWLPGGLTFSSANGDFKFHFGGLVQLDYVAIRNSNPGLIPPNDLATTDSVDFRRLRFRAEGTMYETVDWVSEFDFAQALLNTDQANAAAQNLGLRSIPLGTGTQAGNTINAIQPTNVYLTFKAVPILGNVRIGSQRDWFSLEHVESERFIDFMERATIMDAFVGPNNNGYTPGVSFFNSTENERANVMGGVYKNNTMAQGQTYDLGDHNWTYNARATWTPFYDEVSNGRYLLHLGCGAEYRTYNTNTSAAQGFDNIRLLSRGNLRNASSTIDPNFADTGNFYIQDQTLIDPELALQWGSLLIQAEWVTSFFGGASTTQPGTPGSASLGKNVMTQGGYVEALYFLTGENRVYNRQAGTFVRTIPLQNAFWTRGSGCRGWGAWQVGVRYDWLDLNSQGGPANLNGGNEQDVTLGLNWFLNPNARFTINGVGSMLNNAASATAPGTLGALNGTRFTGDGTVLSVGTRMDFTF